MIQQENGRYLEEEYHEEAADARFALELRGTRGEDRAGGCPDRENERRVDKVEDDNSDKAKLNMRELGSSLRGMIWTHRPAVKVI